MHIKDLDRLWDNFKSMCTYTDDHAVLTGRPKSEIVRAGIDIMRAETERYAMVRAIRFVAKAGRGYVDDPDDIQKLADEVENGEVIIP